MRWYFDRREVSQQFDSIFKDMQMISSAQISPEELMARLEKHFGRLEGEEIIEYERNNNWANRKLGRWNVSDRTPLKFGEIKRVSGDKDIYLLFDTSYSGGGFKYLTPPFEFGFSEDLFYIGRGKQKGDEKPKICYQNLYVPRRKADVIVDGLEPAWAANL